MVYTDQLPVALIRGLAWIEFFAFVFFALFILLLLYIVISAIIDALQHSDAIRHNYPFLGRFRAFFMHLGVFFRAYFFTEDRVEMPFNRADREWVAHAAHNDDLTSAFGSTRSLKEAGIMLFAGSAFPALGRDKATPSEITFGEFTTQKPYTTNKFFHVSAMSFGALSVPAIRALSYGAQMSGILLDTGEGGISPYHLEGGADLVAEIGTAKYGYRDAEGHLDDDKLRQAAALPQVKMFSIKLGQGAKPGKGGLLPGVKVTAEIAAIRGIAVGQDSVSPNRWPEIGNVDQLLDMIAHIRKVTGKPTGFKYVAGTTEMIEELCQKVVQRGIAFAPDFIIIDSTDGGTAAAPATLMDYVGMHIREGLPLLVDVLMRYDLKKQVKVGVSGKLINPAAVGWALGMGADYVNSARGFMFSLGCIQAMRCNKDTCPTGITTHRKHLQSGLDPQDKKVRVMHYAQNVHNEVNIIAHACGLEDPRQLRRHHMRAIQVNGISVSAEQLFPYPKIGEALM